MAKTRSQAAHPTIKKEEFEENPKLKKLLRCTKNAKNNQNKIVKYKIAKTRVVVRSQSIRIKEESTNNKKQVIPSSIASSKRPVVTKEQIKNVIGYIVNDKMSLNAASIKAKMTYMSAFVYYTEYQDDPEHKIPLPKTNLNNPSPKLTQQKIENLIHYIVHDKMNVSRAAYKAKINLTTAAKYHKKYLNDPEQKVPKLEIRSVYLSKRCTQDQIKEVIGYIVNDKMSVLAAAKKAGIHKDSAKRYYLKYLQDPNHEIPVPGMYPSRRCTNEQIEALIGYIENDGMTMLEAAVKANMGGSAAIKYYKQYLDNPDRKIPTPETKKNNHGSNRHFTYDNAKRFFNHVIIDKLSIQEASRKSNISETTGYKYYTKYVRNHNKESEITDITYSPEKMEKLVEYIKNDKMSVKSAATKAMMNYDTSLRLYRQYLKNPQLKFPKIKHRQYTQDDMKRLIDYVEKNKVTVRYAAKKIKMTPTAAQKYYQKYQDDPEHKIPTPAINGQIRKNRQADTYSQIISDIYKNNPSIKPIHESYRADMDRRNISVKQEEFEKKVELKLSV